MITREALKSGILQKLIKSSDDGTVLSQDELDASLDEALAEHPDDDDVLLFAYGSLMWNPAFHYRRSFKGAIAGLHRCFCLWTHLGRGTKKQPGLILGLEHGGACEGLFFDIPAGMVREELTLVWRREMVTGAYRPTWVPGSIGGQPVKALTFVINHDHPRYAKDLEEAVIVDTIARACGPLGRCSDYLFNTVAHLEELAISDRDLARIAEKVRELQARLGIDAPEAERGSPRA